MLRKCLALYLATSLRVVGALTASTPKPDPVELGVTSIWDGLGSLDEQEKERNHENKCTQQLKYTSERDGELQLYVLLGPPDSGTNLLMQLITLNWKNKFRCTHERSPYHPTSDQVPDCYGELWKHSNSGPDDIYSVLETNMENTGSHQKIKDTVAIIMVRSPISQIASWKKAPYDLRECASRPYEDMAKPCRASLQARKSGIKMPSTFLNFGSTMDAYNQYMKQYRTIKAHSRFKDVVLITYEDLVYSPEEQLKRIAGAFGIEIPEVTVQVESKAKLHGSSHGREEAIQKLRTRTYLNNINKQDLKLLCKGIDMDILHGYTEGTNLTDDLRVDYTYDCRDYK